MRIVNRKEFLSMPPGTLFRKYETNDLSELMIKEDTWTNDFRYTEMLDNHILGDSEDTDEIYKAEKDSTYDIKTSNYCIGRDGLFDDDQLFAVYSHDELMSLIVMLVKTWNNLTGNKRILSN